MRDSTKIRVATEAVKEIQSLSSADSDAVMTFLERLASNPYDNAIIGAASAKGDFFASNISDRLYVYWAFDAKGQNFSMKKQPKIKVLSIARKTPGGSQPPFRITAPATRISDHAKKL
jgi:hypothetical protein